MHFSLLEKLGFGVLVAAWVVWGSIQIGNALVSPQQLAENAYPIDVPESAESQTASAEPAEPEPDLPTLLAEASADAGAKVFRKCAGCHGVEDGGAHKVGPNLHGVVGRKQGGADGYSYSDALAGLGGEWTYENLDAFLKNPNEYVSGNKMTFAGLKKGDDRAEVILYLRENSPSAPPLP